MIQEEIDILTVNLSILSYSSSLSMKAQDLASLNNLQSTRKEHILIQEDNSSYTFAICC